MGIYKRLSSINWVELLALPLLSVASQGTGWKVESMFLMRNIPYAHTGFNRGKAKSILAAAIDPPLLAMEIYNKPRATGNVFTKN